MAELTETVVEGEDILVDELGNPLTDEIPVEEDAGIFILMPQACM